MHRDESAAGSFFSPSASVVLMPIFNDEDMRVLLKVDFSTVSSLLLSQAACR
jgi:hypothetical protein